MPDVMVTTNKPQTCECMLCTTMFNQPTSTDLEKGQHKSAKQHQHIHEEHYEIFQALEGSNEQVVVDAQSFVHLHWHACIGDEGNIL